MRIKWKPLIISVLLPLVVGGLSALLAGNSMEAFQSFKQPPLSPPGWLFPIVWTALYVLMGVASYLVAASDAPAGEIKNALKAYAIQLAINFFWSILFFRFGLLWFSFFLAFASMGISCGDDHFVWQNIQNRRPSFNTLSFVGHLCGVSEFCCCFAELGNQ